MREIMISSTVMILLVMLFRVIFRGKVRHCLIYAMWLFVALRLLVPVNIGRKGNSGADFCAGKNAGSVEGV